MLREVKKVAGIMMVLEAGGGNDIGDSESRDTVSDSEGSGDRSNSNDRTGGGDHDRDSGNSKNNIGHSFMMVWVMRWAFQVMRIMMMTVVTGGNCPGNGGNDCIVNDGDDKV